MRRVGNVLTRRKGVGVFGSALLRREGVRGFGFGIGCSGVIQMTRDGRRQVGTGRIGVGSVTVVTNGQDVKVTYMSDPSTSVVPHDKRIEELTRNSSIAFIY